jgi:hypothetical protein
MEFDQILRKVYALYLADGSPRVPLVEQHLGPLEPDALTVDDRRNVQEYYRQLTEEHATELQALFRRLCDDMRELSFERASGLIDALRFLQNVIAIALWKYGLAISRDLESFTRGFDRLDVVSERRRLYEQSQKVAPLLDTAI